jgi:hypothetical protein
MRKILAACVLVGVLGCGGDSTGPGKTLTADKINGLWDFSFTAPSACGALRGAVVPARLTFEGTDIGNTNTGWTNDPAGIPDRWPLVGTIDFKTRLMDLRFWTVVSSIGFDVNGTVSQDGTSFSGTAVDPIPGYTPYASLGQCRYDVTGQRRTDQSAPIAVEGRWSGPVDSVATLNLTLSRSGSSVGGSGSLVSTNTTIPFDVSGTYTAPNFVLTLTAQGYQPLNFTGTASATTLSGTLDGSGFTNTSVTLTRQ